MSLNLINYYIKLTKESDSDDDVFFKSFYFNIYYIAIAIPKTLILLSHYMSPLEWLNINKLDKGIRAQGNNIEIGKQTRNKLVTSRFEESEHF
jgi:hypothetical protein